MDQYDYLTRDQLISLARAFGMDRAEQREPAPDNPAGLPEFGERALRDFESSESPMRIFDRETLQYLAVNDAAIKFYGYSREEFLALTIRDTRHPEEHAAQLASLRQSSSYIQYDGSRRQVKKSGEVVVVELVNQDVLFSGHNARLALTIDITGRLRVQELLWRRQQEFESLAENLPDLVVRYDRDRCFLYVNSAVERTLGLGRSQIVGRTQRELGLPDALVALCDGGLAGEIGQTHKVEFRLALPSGERQFEAHHVAETDGAGRIGSVLCVARDITERKQDELALLHGTALARLLESLARAVNQALTSEDAMVACLERICRHGHWAIGRVELYERGRPAEVAGRSIWYAPERERFEGLIRFSTNRVHGGQGPFIGRLLREHTAVWLEDLRKLDGFTRREPAVAHGLLSAFAFPVIVRGELLAIMEVFGEEARTQDPHLMGAAHSLASQLARIVEREWAHQANTRMAAIVESSHDAIVSRTLDGKILTWNRAAERLFGYTVAEIVGRNIGILYPEELKPEMFQRQGMLLEGRIVPPYETVRVAKDGRRVHVSTGPAAIRDSSGHIIGVSTIVQDITERKVAEEALRRSEERFRQLAENIDQVFWIDTPACDSNQYVSPAFARIWGRSVESMRWEPNSWWDSIHPEDRPRVAEAIRGIARGQHLDIQYRIVRPDGAVRWIRDRSYPMRPDDGMPLVCGIAEDITAQKRTEQEQLSQAIHQRDALVREVHHRIKNSLQGVAGLLREKSRKFPAIASDIEEAIMQLQTVAVVYGLQGTRADGLLSLAEIVEAICASAEGLLGGRVDRVFERQSARPACVAGSEAVSMAVGLNELVFNALKHQRAPAGKKRAQVALCEKKDTAEIRITNRGRLPKRFDFSANIGVGTGLGLVRTLMSSPGASVEFAGKGGDVEVLLKLRPPLLAERRSGPTKKAEHDNAGEEKAAAAYPGRR